MSGDSRPQHRDILDEGDVDIGKHLAVQGHAGSFIMGRQVEEEDVPPLARLLMAIPPRMMLVL